MSDIVKSRLCCGALSFATQLMGPDGDDVPDSGVAVIVKVEHTASGAPTRVQFFREDRVSMTEPIEAKEFLDAFARCAQLAVEALERSRRS